MEHHRKRQGRLSDDVEIEVRVEQGQGPGELSLERPVLTYGHHAFYGNAWTLWYRDELGAVEQNCIPGSVADVEAAVRLAREFLAPLQRVRTQAENSKPRRQVRRRLRGRRWAGLAIDRMPHQGRS